MNPNQKRIKEHYDGVQDVGLDKREIMETIGIRKMNNFIKSMLINEHVFENNAVLDIGCGKGGDLKKFASIRIGKYYGLDISENSIENAKRRYRHSYIRFKADFSVGDAYNSPFCIGMCFDAISIQFSFHYAFVSQNTLRTTLQNIKNHLHPNGRVIATVPDSGVLLRRYKKYGNNYGNRFYSVNFMAPYEQILSLKSKLGIEYLFTLSNSLDSCVEYLVDMEALSNGFNEVMEQADKVRSRELVYAIFTIDSVIPVRYKVTKTLENNFQSSARDTMHNHDLVENLYKLKSDVSDDMGHFVIYDFGFYKADQSFRNVLCLFSIIPDTLKVNERVAFSTSSLQLPAMLNVAKHIPFNNANDISFEDLVRICMAHKPN
ncbi:UNVERIFIED_CONTAM: hypothetical protein PYX00_011253 [Menopon gallinae]|uniref:mRNA (guanine-N(7))-methyltransferase n=1 Tax=Menopon gallinae TaxID=328185 RepID=A0AAW2H728_9NEOP